LIKKSLDEQLADRGLRIQARRNAEKKLANVNRRETKAVRIEKKKSSRAFRALLKNMSARRLQQLGKCTDT
jgi:hypothetical protein